MSATMPEGPAGFASSAPAGPGAAADSARRRRLRRLSIALLVAGALVFALLGLSECAGEWRGRQAVERSELQVNSLGLATRIRLFAQARTYNWCLAGHEAPKALKPYAQQLAFGTEGIMGWIDIPAIGVREPVYHGCSDSVLMDGAGHMEGSSLPVGGPSTHALITGHSGMAGSPMFEGLHRMKVGDEFAVTILGSTFRYRTTAIDVVEPDDASALAIKPGRDLCTLVTCTPIGINSHRLLVRGERVKGQPPGDAEEPVAWRFHGRMWYLLVPLAIAVLLAVIAWRNRRGDDPEAEGADGRVCGRAEGGALPRAGRTRGS